MPKFIAVHKMPGVTKEMLEPMGKASQQDPNVRGIRSYTNLSEGKIFCEFEAPDEETLKAWFTKMNMPYESVTKVDLYGERGVIKELK